MIELFECVRLSARISKAQCQVNRFRVGNNRIDVLAISACKGCPGLGAPVNIVPEVVSMPRSRCVVHGCVRQAQHGTGGMCKSHFKGTVARNVKRPAAVAGPLPLPVVSEVERVAEPGSCCGECGVSPCVCVEAVPNDGVPGQVAISTLMRDVGLQTIGGPEIVIMRALRDAWSDKEREWLADLAGLRPGAAIVRAASMIKSVEGLVY